MTEDRLDKIKSKYEGEIAENYEDSRKSTKHWRREQKIIESLLDEAGIGEGSHVLDIPVGTGRFFPLYKERGYNVIGMDASPDMLSEAKRKAGEIGYSQVNLTTGDITDLQLANGSADLSICIRLMNWLDYSSFRRALSELKRVSAAYVIIGIRMSTGGRHVKLYSWLKEVFRGWKKSLKIVAGYAQRSLRRNELDTYSSEPDSVAPSLIDHPEADVRREFQNKELTVAREEHAMSFTSAPRLSGFGVVEELPYHIFLLRV